MNQIIKKISKEEQLINYDGKDRVVSSYEKEKEIEEGSKKFFKIFSHIPTLDKYIDGFESGEMVIVAGATGQGKTTFCQFLTNQFAAQQQYSIWFSYEVTPYQFFKKFDKLPLFYLPNVLAGKTINWIEDRIIEAKVKYGIKVVFIDHLHYLLNFGYVNNITPEIDYIVRNLKLLALNHNLVLFLMCHLSKVRVDEELENSHLRNSAMIAGEADSVLMIKRDKQRENTSWLKITKSRRIGVMNKKIPLLYKGGAEFQEITENFSDDEIKPLDLI
ncbi:MAG: DnaB-like helicase C-terminal domain-containing protein [Candidatus Aenigmatarchaeota archaeon]